MGNRASRESSELRQRLRHLHELIQDYDTRRQSARSKDSERAALVPLPASLQGLVWRYLHEPEALATPLHTGAARDQYEYVVKLSVAGASRVGKTRLMEQAEKYFGSCQLHVGKAAGPVGGKHVYTESVGVSFASLQLRVAGAQVKVSLWDLSGAPRYRHVVESYLRGNFAVLLLFHQASRASFEALDDWFELVKLYQKPMVVVALKEGANSQVSVTFQEASAWAAVRSSPCLQVQADMSREDELAAALGAAVRRYAETDVWRHCGTEQEESTGQFQSRQSEVLYPVDS